MSARRPFTDREVDEAVAFFTGVSPLRYATADGVADQAATQVLAGLPRRLRRPQPRPAALGHPGVGHRGVPSLVDPTT